MTTSHPHKRASGVHFEQSTKVLHFAPKGLFAAGQALALNTELGTLSHLSWQDDHPVQLMEQQFTGSEIGALLPLLQVYPYYCPYEVLLSSFDTGQVTDEMLLQYQARLQKAQQADQWDELMRPVRCVLSRIRLKIRHFNLTILAINGTGYVLRGANRVPVTSPHT